MARVSLHAFGMARRVLTLVVLIGIAAAERDDDLSALSALVAAQGRQLEQMQQQLQSQTAAMKALELAAQHQGHEHGAAMRSSAPEQDFLDSESGRQLADAPATQRKTWHHSVLHSFDDPSSCGLHAELDSDETGPMDITRSSDGNVTMGYGGASSTTQPAPFELNHPANCRSATLTSNHPLAVAGSLTVAGQRSFPGPGILKCQSSRTPTDSGTVAATGRRKCVCRSDESHGNVGMENCHHDWDRCQWTWFGKMMQVVKIDNSATRCWRAQNDFNVVTSYCNNNDGDGNNDNAQEYYFHFDGEQIKNGAAGAAKCLQCVVDSDTGDANVKLKDCSGSVRQKWYWYRPGDPNP